MKKRNEFPVKRKWDFSARFRRGAYGWRSSSLAAKRVRSAVAEIEAVARKNPVAGAEGGVLFLEKVSPALEHVDSSSGAIGSSVWRAIEALVAVIRAGVAEAVPEIRDAWLDRLWKAHEEDEIPYIESLDDFWGDLCGSPETASIWADRLLPIVGILWGPDRKPGDYFKGTSACLSCLLAAGRHRELLDLLERAPHPFWHYRMFGARALEAMGRPDEAVRYAEDCAGLDKNAFGIAAECERILLRVGRTDEAYARYAFDANRASTHLATFRAISGKYAAKKPAEILCDLTARSFGEEGKWFAAAKEYGLYDEAIALARKSPCDPRTLSRAARDYAEKRPEFAVEAGLAALEWISEGYGYEISGLDVREAHARTMQAAAHAGRSAEVSLRVRRILDGTGPRSELFRMLERHLASRGDDAS